MQADYVVDNASGAVVRSDINTQLQAVATNNSGTTAPSVTYPRQWWPDETSGRLKQRNAANTAWVDMGALDASNMGHLASSNNLSDLDSPSTARSNLGLILGTNTGEIPTADQIPSLAGGVSVRQTVLSGPLDNNGFSNFGGTTGTTTVTTSGTLIVTAAGGFGPSGAVDRIGSVTNPSWTGLSTNGTMYLFLDIAEGGTCSTVSSSVAPIYQWGGTPASTSGLLTFNIQSMSGYVGNGSTAPQSYRVCIGEVNVSGGVVSSITWYAIMGRYDGGLFPVSGGTTYTRTHNIGLTPGRIDVYIADDSSGTNEGPLVGYWSGTANCAYWRGTSSRKSISITTTSVVGLSTSGSPLSSAYYRVRASRLW